MTKQVCCIEKVDSIAGTELVTLAGHHLSRHWIELFELTKGLHRLSDDPHDIALLKSGYIFHII